MLVQGPAHPLPSGTQARDPAPIPGTISNSFHVSSAEPCRSTRRICRGLRSHPGRIKALVPPVAGSTSRINRRDRIILISSCFFHRGNPEVLEDGPVEVTMGATRAGSCSCAAMGSLAWAGNSRSCAGHGPLPMAGWHRRRACPDSFISQKQSLQS